MRDLQLLQNLVAATVKAFRYLLLPPLVAAIISRHVNATSHSCAFAALMKRRMWTPAFWLDESLGCMLYFSYF